MLNRQVDSQEDEYWKTLEEAESYVIDAIAETMDLYGVTPSVGRLYGVLYFSEGPMNLNEMSNSLGMSKPSMSTGIHSLMDIDMVQKVWKRGERKDLYVAEKDFFKSFINFFCKKWDREISVNLEAIKKANEQFITLLDDQVPQSVQEKAKKNLQQLEDATQYYLWLKKLVQGFRSEKLIDLIEKNSIQEKKSD
ncbi:GbsR/MarR family transcriptional regulator [Bacillus sp. PK3_68]|uniref:choline uptake/conversion transcriptional regulator CudC n=1 Tax=Bacillus sp. PK3_68 TaxID=2027408 RepID=UPI000E7659C5|nr:GbsR/MarR family transcriptional regulator [Bacillus sp. PK3_68]RJS50065.1 GbsR/MarR family transcriptional regulator [Bacillus sp. PK3_68]